MAAETKIQWCDSTFNAWMGCTRVSAACDHCYAAVSAPARTRKIEWGPGRPRVKTEPENWAKPVKWNADPFFQCTSCDWRGPASQLDESASRCPRCVQQTLQRARRRVFCLSLGDWLDNEVPIEWLVELLDLIRQTPNLDWLLLTKRIGNFKDRIDAAKRHVNIERKGEGLYYWLRQWAGGKAPYNVWLGSTVIDQREADRDIPKLLQTPSRVRFLSIEPMLGPVTVFSIDGPVDVPAGSKSPLHWVIGGFESGRQARPGHPDWARSLRDECAAAGVAFLWKQNGEFREYDTGDNETHVASVDDPTPLAQQALAEAVRPCFVAHDGRMFSTVDEIPYDLRARMLERVGKKTAGNLLDGRLHMEFPA